MASQQEIRRKILAALYDCHRSEAFCPLKTANLIEMLGLDDEEEFYRALQYLHDEDYVKGIFLPYERQGYFESARITGKGVDAAQDPSELDRLFPPE